jgi:dTDP-4-dehydrorhamnose reductase
MKPVRTDTFDKISGDTLRHKIVITGASGQLGRELACSHDGQWDCQVLARGQLDIGDAAAVTAALEARQPALVINAAAYTAVDAAESDAAAAWRANAEGPANLARTCRAIDARLIHISTDFVFDGRASQPYPVDAPTAPLGEYGRSKLAGEEAVRELLPAALIVRTGWVYSSFGHNFVKTMLRLMTEREELGVVVDQVGTPTWARGLAAAVWAAAARPQLAGTYHWSDAGVCSWYDFAVAICEEACAIGLLAGPVAVRPIPGSDYPTPARRPSYSVLDKAASWRDFALEGVHWRQQLRAMLTQYKEMQDE